MPSKSYLQKKHEKGEIIHFILCTGLILLLIGSTSLLSHKFYTDKVLKAATKEMENVHFFWEAAERR